MSGIGPARGPLAFPTADDRDRLTTGYGTTTETAVIVGYMFGWPLAIWTHAYSRIADLGTQDAGCCVAVLGPPALDDAEKVVAVNIEGSSACPGRT